MNYEITKNWQSLSDLLGENYDSTKKYRIHNNVKNPAKLCLTEVQNPLNNTKGRIYPEFCEIYVDSGNNPKLKVMYSLNLQSGFDVEITEVL